MSVPSRVEAVSAKSKRVKEGQSAVSTEELMTQREAARYVGILPERTRELAAQQMLQGVLVQGPNGSEMMYYTSEVLRLKERLRGPAPQAATDAWPDVIDE